MNPIYLVTIAPLVLTKLVCFVAGGLLLLAKSMGLVARLCRQSGWLSYMLAKNMDVVMRLRETIASARPSFTKDVVVP